MGVESKGVPGTDGSTSSAAAMVWLKYDRLPMSLVVRIRQGARKYSRGKGPDNLNILETDRAGISKAVQDLLDGVERLGNETVRSGTSGDVTAEEEGQTRSTRAVADSDGTSKLDAIERSR